MKTTPPRLLSLNSYHYRRGGSDVVYLEHDALFQELGWETAVMSMHHPKNMPSRWSEYFVEELEFGNAHGIKDKLVKAMVTGTPVVALCGKVWVPSRNPDRYPVCPECKEIFQSMNPGSGDE